MSGEKTKLNASDRSFLKEAMGRSSAHVLKFTYRALWTNCTE